MQQITVPPLIAPTVGGSLADLPHDWAEREPGRTLIRRRRQENDGPDDDTDPDETQVWSDVSAAQFAADVRSLAAGFIAAGIEVGDRVAVMSRTRYEWTLVDFALWTAGAVPVPIYETSSAHQVSWILSDSGAVAMVAETPEHAAVVAQIRTEAPDLRDVWQIDAGSLEEIVAAGAEIDGAIVQARRVGLDRSSPATLIYTSGTTGTPKGCELSHGNFLSLAENAVERLDEVIGRPGASTLIFLPLAHVFARFIEVAVMQAGAVQGHTHASRVLEDLGTFRPTFVLAVPRVFEKIYNSAEQKAETGGRGAIFRRAARTAVAWSQAQDGNGPGVLLRAQHALFNRLVYGKLREAMGGHVQYAISGGAALGSRLGHFFRGIGVTVLEGYGLTETTAPTNVNTPELIKIGTVGRPLPGVAIKIAADGEILTRGVGVFHGYRGWTTNHTLFQGGWYRTGDLGSLDDEGFLTITGRKKDVIITAGGKNVSPGPLEDMIRAHPLVSQCVVVGEARPFVAALVTLDEEMYPAWAANHGLTEVSFDQAPGHAAVRAAIQEAIDQANQEVSRAESVRAFRILQGDLTEENGYLTPSLKVKRSAVVEAFAAQITAIYSR